jgi:hypothetical protein
LIQCKQRVGDDIERAMKDCLPGADSSDEHSAAG